MYKTCVDEKLKLIIVVARGCYHEVCDLSTVVHGDESVSRRTIGAQAYVA